MPNCSKCGGEIKFLNSNGKNVIVNPKFSYYLPRRDEAAVKFIMADGRVNVGIKGCAEGIKGYELHSCF